LRGGSDLYFVDREKIDILLRFFEKQIDLFEQTYEWNTEIEKAALERITHLIIEVFLDVGNDMIDGFIMRDPGSYEDIIDILTDEQVITNEMSVELKKIVSYRKILVQQYTEIPHDQLTADFFIALPVLKQFAPKVKAYLHNQLGPVSAFKN
jgi:uncharacterized protein YutE (UPF0331/DUF86 family)